MNTTLFIRITGQVQGVGFRPFVYQLAIKHQLSGWVNNSLEGVHILVSGKEEALDEFVQELKTEKPAIAWISEFSVEPAPFQDFPDFRIVKSNREGSGQLVLTPDLAICPSCRAELRDPENRRYRYPFITCNYCGPRYSLLRGLPYDRERTSMEPFSMCPSCLDEYTRHTEWRFFSQTNSCTQCGMSVALYDRDFHLLQSEYEPCIGQVVEALEQGKIVAVKGIGGYLLLCDANHREALKTLRERKGRARKPFALMYPSLEAAALDVQLEEPHRKALLGAASPIVLAFIRPEHNPRLCLDQIAPGLDQLGVMIPYAPLFELILGGFGRPVVATSANRSASPIVYKDGKALYELSKMADLILVHDREIIMPQDDSVLRFSKKHRQSILVRRSRGLAPAFIHPPFDGLSETIVAMGADMKSAFGFLHRGFAYISQYFGDLDSFDTQERFRQCREHFTGMFEAQPARVLVDRHPQYFSTQLGLELAREKNIPLVEVPHHEAHFAAVLGENHLLEDPSPVLGVIWDGTGMGNDGQIWGGEFFIFEKGVFSRTGHLDYFDLILGDKMPKEPRITALSVTRGIPGAEGILRPKFSDSEWYIYEKLLSRTNNLRTSSMGRLFDTVGSLLGILDVAEYEGEAPLYLEQVARRWFEEQGLGFSGTYFFGDLKTGKIHTKSLVAEIVEDILNGEPTGKIAAKFHNTLVESVRQLSRHRGVSRLAFSGGVFQNELLIDLLIERLGKSHQLFFHSQLSPNDECIAFGQLAWYYLIVRT
ncbi:MAG: carbamoyltransferase HypF [Saprospirales bacterium]|nr:carbamoyltransferase HypF [Saprospirales bacterium]